MSGARFKDITSIEDMLGWQKKSFNEFLKLDSSGVSEFTMEQIKAKSAVLDLTDSLTLQAIAKAKDADFTAKVAAKSLTWGDALKDNSIDIKDLGDALQKSKLFDNDTIEMLNESLELGGIDLYRSRLTDTINDIEGLSDSIIDLGTITPKSTGFLSGLEQTFKGVAASLKPLLPLMATAAAIFAAYKAIDYLQSGWTRASEAAKKATSEFKDADSELESLKSQKEEQKTRVQEIATKYNIDTQELQNANGELKDVDQMIGVINSHGGISIVDKGELDGISSANSQLEAQLAIQEQITEAKKQAMILATEKSASTEKTYYEQMKEEYGAFQGFIKWIQGRSHFEIDKYGNQVYKGESDADKFYGDTGDSTSLGLFKTRLSELKEYKEELKNINKEINESKKNGDVIAQDTIDRRNELIDSITNSSSDLAGLVDTISSQIEILSQGDSDFAVSWVKDAKEAINDFNTIDLSPTEKNLKQIESYFNGSKVSNNLKGKLLEAAKSGKSATDALHEMGITLNDLGITGDGKKAVFDDYFSGLVKSAEEAQQAINSIDGSVDGVKAAFESENKDADWNSMAEYLKQAEEIYSETKKSAQTILNPPYSSYLRILLIQMQKNLNMTLTLM